VRIPDLENVPFLTRVIIAIVVLVAAFLCVLLASQFVEGQTPPLLPTKYDARMLELDKLALDDAYRKQLGLLFSVWLQDNPADVSRITRGLNNARRAYIVAADKIAQREARQ
jgi:hypothetical protein